MNFAGDWITIYATADSEDPKAKLTVHVSHVERLLLNKDLYVISKAEYQLLESVKNSLRLGIGRI